MAELVGHFVDGTPPLLAQIRQGLATEDVGSLERAVHTLKGKSAMFGATTLFNLCHELEFAVTAENFQRASEMVDQIEAESVRVESVLVEKFAIKR